jgi:Protein of unknown function (DUF1574)
VSAVRHRRAGRAVVSAAVVFVVAQLALHIALETVRPEWRDPEYGWRLKALRALDPGGRPLVVAFGSSRTQMGLSPHDLGAGAPVVFNFGQAGAGPMQTLVNLRRVLDAGVKPDAVLVEIMPATLAYRGTSESFYHDTIARLDAADLWRLAPYCESTTALRNRWLAARAVPWYDLRMLLLSHWQPTLLHWKQRIDFQWRLMDDRGWAKFPFETIDDSYRVDQTARSVAQYGPTLREFEIAAIAERVLIDTVATCRRAGIPLAFYRMPEGSVFREMLPTERRARLDTFMEKFAEKQRLSVFDCSNWQPDTDFSDGHHMLPTGARSFSERFGQECLGRWPIDRRAGHQP